jgi:hypothetical protein
MTWPGMVEYDLLTPDETHLQMGLVDVLSVEVWFEKEEEPQRITVYQAPNFWMMQNWQGEWIAVSAEKSYLFKQ